MTLDDIGLTPRRSARLASAGVSSMKKRITNIAASAMDDVVRGQGSWVEMRATMADNDDEFKNSLIKDAETVSLVSALVLTVAFAALLAPVKEAPENLRVAYLFSVFLSISFSLIGCVIAVRTVMLMNAIQEDKTIEALQKVSRYRLHPCLNAFNFTTWALLNLLVSTVLFMACEYGLKDTEVILSAGVFIITVLYIGHEANMMDRVGEEIRGSKRGYV